MWHEFIQTQMQHHWIQIELTHHTNTTSLCQSQVEIIQSNGHLCQEHVRSTETGTRKEHQLPRAENRFVVTLQLYLVIDEVLSNLLPE